MQGQHSVEQLDDRIGIHGSANITAYAEKRRAEASGRRISPPVPEG